MSEGKKTAAGKKKERRFPVAISWIAFVVAVLVGAGFISSQDPQRQVIGFLLLFAPLVVFSLLMGAFYWRSRRYAERAVDEGAEGPEE